jgi:Ca-activated chloride channel family protein
MTQLMRCPYCGLLQDEPSGVKSCARCGGGLEYESTPPGAAPYVQVQMELDQVAAPANQNLERYLLLTIRTPKQVPAEEAAPAVSGRPPLNFSAVLDVSGSMQGEKIQQAKLAVQQAAKYLHSGDTFSLVTFANEIHTPIKPSQVNDGSYQAVERALEQVNAGGMTALCSGLESGIEMAGVHPQDTNLVLLLSDGQANVGETDLEKIGSRAFQARQQGCLVSCLGVGLDYNEALLAEVATQGGGRFYHVQNANQIPAYLAGELGEAALMAAREVKIQLTIPEGATLIPLSAAYPVQQAGGQAVVSVGGIPCDSELEIPLRLALLAQPAGARLSIQGKLEFRSPAGHQLEYPVNRVTLRFVAQDAFHLRQGVVLPVAERVFMQMKANSVLNVARMMAHKPEMAEQQTEVVLTSLRSYAGLLGEERVKKEMDSILEQFSTLTASPAASKQSVSDAHRFIRATKDFNQ